MDANDASNGDVTVTLSQLSADGNGYRSAPTGTKFEYRLSLGCSVPTGTQGDCLTGATVTLDLSAWKDYTVTPGAADANVTAPAWSPSTGILTLTIVDIAQEGRSFNWDFSITTPKGVTRSDPRDLSFDAAVVATDFAGATSNQVASHITTISPDQRVTKSARTASVFPGEDVTWEVGYTSTTSDGVEIPTSRIVSDPIPVGLEYVSCSAWAAPGWGSCSYAPSTRTVTWTAINDTWTASQILGTIVTKVPAGTTANTTISNTAALDAVDADGTPTHHQATATISTSAPTLPTVAISKSVDAAITSPSPQSFLGDWIPNEALDREVTFHLSSTVSGATASMVTELALTDDLPCLSNRSGTNYASLKSGQCQAPAFYLTAVEEDTNLGAQPSHSGTWVPKGVLTDGTTVNLDKATQATWRVPASVVGKVIRVELPRKADDGSNGISPVGNARTIFNLHGYLPDEEGLVAGDTITNTKADWTAWLPSNPDAFYTAQTSGATVTVASNREGVHQGYTWGQTQCSPPAAGETTANFCLAAIGWAGTSGLIGPFVTVSDLWPANLPIPDSLFSGPTLWCDTTPTCATPAASVRPTITLDYTSTQHLIQWRIPVAAFNALQPRDPAHPVTLRTLIPNVPLPDYSTYTNELNVQMSAADNPNGLETSGNRVADTADLDKDAATGFRVTSSLNLALTPATGTAGFSLTKQAHGDRDQGFRTSPARANADPGGTATYRLTWKNTGATDLNNTVIYDLLPMPGDRSALADGSPRSSEFLPTLFSVASTSGVAIAYSTAANPCRPEVFANNPGCVDQWTDIPPTPLTGVKALRWTNTNTYRFGQSWSVDFTMDVPADITPDDTAWNSAAGASVTSDGFNTPLVAVQTPVIGLQAAQTGDAVWHKQSNGRAAIGGTEWQLTAVNGQGQPLAGAAAYTARVVDNTGGTYTGLDLDPTAGSFRVSGLTTATRYQLIEQATPAGYVLDQTPHYATAVDVDDWGFGTIVNNVYSTASISSALTGSYDIDYAWTLAKSVDSATATVKPGEPATFEYTVQAGVTQKVGDPVTSGTLTITNPNAVAITGRVTATSSQSGTCTIANGGVITIPAATGGNPGTSDVSVTCTYGARQVAADTITLRFADDTAGTSVITTTGTTQFAVGQTRNATVTLTDSFDEFGAPRTLDAATVLATPSAGVVTYAAERTSKTPGGCKSYLNTASIAATADQARLEAEAGVTVCAESVNPIASGSATGGFEQDYDWSLTKSVDRLAASAPAGQQQAFTYTVTASVTKQSVSKVAAKGTVNFANQNATDLVGVLTISSVSGGDCKLTNGTHATLAALGGLEVPFTCTYPDVARTSDDAVTVSFSSGDFAAATAVAVPFVVTVTTDQTMTLSDTFAEFAGPVEVDAKTVLANPAAGVFSYVANRASDRPNECAAFPNTATLNPHSDHLGIAATVTVNVCATAANAGQERRDGNDSTVAGDIDRDLPLTGGFSQLTLVAGLLAAVGGAAALVVSRRRQLG